MEILIVEDDKITRELLAGILKNYGNCTIANNGSIALELFKKKFDAGEYYNLICLDIMMPNLDGLSTLKELRFLERTYDVPVDNQVKILMVTALDDQSIIFESYMAGTTGYIVKPIVKQDVEDELRKLELI